MLDVVIMDLFNQQSKIYRDAAFYFENFELKR